MEHGLSKFLNRQQLEASDVVANCRMNRERQATGSNGYQTDVKVNPIEYLTDRIEANGSANWLDICCGSGRALIETAEHFCSSEVESPNIIGIDLVSFFLAKPSHLEQLQLQATPIDDWQPEKDQFFDLITCVHGLHYLGDKLRTIQRSIVWLKPNGLFAANLDLENLRFERGDPMSAAIRKRFAELDIEFDPTHHLLTKTGSENLDFGFQYLGATDQAGPNYTGQPAVNSYYR